MAKLSFSFVFFILCICSNMAVAQNKVKKGMREGKRKEVDLSNYYITLKLQNSLSYLSGILEWSIDSLIRKEPDVMIQNNLVSLKYNLINVLSKTAFHSDPLLGAIDSWALDYQLVDYFKSGNCDSLYGQHCAFFANVFDRYLSGYEKELGPYVSEEDRQELKTFATKYPIRDSNLNRQSVVPYISAWVSEDELKIKSGLLTMTDLMRDMSFRVQYYSEMVPKQAKWQLENTLQTYLMKDSITNMMNTMHNLMLVSASTIGSTEDMINFNRDSILANIDYHRRISLHFLQNERIATLEAMSKEREILLEAMQNERKAIEVFAAGERKAMVEDFKAMSSEILRESVSVGKELIDYIFIKSLILIAMVSAFLILGLFIYKRMEKT